MSAELEARLAKLERGLQHHEQAIEAQKRAVAAAITALGMVIRGIASQNPSLKQAMAHEIEGGLHSPVGEDPATRGILEHLLCALKQPTDTSPKDLQGRLRPVTPSQPDDSE